MGRTYVLIAIALGGMILGFILWALGQPELAPFAWTLATIPVLAGLLLQIISSLRRGDVGLDVLAALSMTAALLFGEQLAANVVAVMYAGGQWLESYAQRRAGRDMKALLDRVPRFAMKYHGQEVRQIPIEDIVPGDHLLIRQGDVIPVDGQVVDGPATLDLSVLTGESLPVTAAAGMEVLSGATLAGPSFRLEALRSAAGSTYAGIIKLVEAAQNSRAPMTRLADRYAVGFLIIAVLAALVAYLISGEPVRALAVLVVATPCPLILAVPIAVVSGMSKAARHGVLIKNGGTLEGLAAVHTAIIDKTGTLTQGRAEVVAIGVTPGQDPSEVLRLAASLDQASGHVVAEALVAAARHRGLSLSAPLGVEEVPGTGISGTVEGRAVIVGGAGFVRSRAAGVEPREIVASHEPGLLSVAVAIEGRIAGVIQLQDRLRPDAPEAVSGLRALGIGRIVLASGDRTDIAEHIGAAIGADLVLGELLPDQKLALVRREQRDAPVLVIGDGVNDAPALAEASIGVAMGARGTAASSEAAGVVLLVDRLAPLVEGIRVAQATRRIAVQSVIIGMGLSMLGMGAAALGYITPIQGALLQEGIDVAVILNALRALR
ncbi:heavy metal translocating P-type ATPase [Devosia salina]|uniref:P-type Zn(2+) transporter n=1 Tax=Devosia salina TaxID=2860336 RepID=A0ABX8WKL5_9HYPH|nr:heavy metal translocating P-type ATPase [Devosia salina]QYO78309.1 cadmium-translocating P-type ATPase [Devosia salina]